MKTKLLLTLLISTQAFANSLVGTWKMTDLRCESGAQADAEVKQQVLAMASDAKLVFKDNGSYTFSAGDLNTIGTYSLAGSNNMKMTVGSAGEQSVDYEIRNGELLMYQPLGYLRDQLCGSESRGVQVLKKQNAK